MTAPMTVSHNPVPPNAPPSPTAPRPASTNRTPTAPRTTRVVVLSIRVLPLLRRRVRPGAALRLDDDRGPVGDDLGHRPGQLRAVEPHRDHRVRPHQRRVLHEPVERLPTGVLEERGVLVDLTAAERSQARDQVAGEAAAPHDEPERLALRLDDAVAGDERGGGDDHLDP